MAFLIAYSILYFSLDKGEQLSYFAVGRNAV